MFTIAPPTCRLERIDAAPLAESAVPPSPGIPPIVESPPTPPCALPQSTQPMPAVARDARSLRKLKVDTLRRMCNTAGLASVGKKEILIERLLANQ